MADDAKSNLTGGHGGDENKNPPAPPPARGNQNAFKGISFTVEFATKDNCNTQCPVTKRTMRGRMVWSLIRRREPDERFADCPNIPGLVLQYDGMTRTVTVRDPMALKSMEQTLKQAQKAIQAMGWAKPEPERPRQFKNVGDDTMKQFVYWARRWLDNGQVELRQGTIPSMEEIVKLPGRIERERWNTSVKRERFQKDPKMFGDREVPEYLTPAQAHAAAEGDALVGTDDLGYTDTSKDTEDDD